MHRYCSTIAGQKRVRHGAFLLAMACCAEPAMAQKPTEARLAADVLFEQGKAALVAGDWAKGCGQFHQSQKLDPSASTLVKLARCHEHEGQFRAALVDYDQALILLRLLPENDAHARELTALVMGAKGELEPRLGTLRLQLSPSLQQFRMEIDGEAIESQAAALPLRLDPGEHRIAVVAPEYQSASVQLTLAEGELRQIAIELQPNPASPMTSPPGIGVVPAPTRGATAPPTPPTQGATSRESPTPTKSSSGAGHRILSIASMTTGGVAVGVAGYYAIETRRLVQDSRANDDCDSNFNCNAHGLNLLDQAGKAQTMAIVLGSAGGLLVGLGVVLWATAPKERVPSAPPRVALHVSPTGALLRGYW